MQNIEACQRDVKKGYSLRNNFPSHTSYDVVLFRIYSLAIYAQDAGK